MLRYLALGDSYTIGEGVPESQRWPEQLVASLRRQGIGIDRPRIIATTGWTTDELAAAMEVARFAPPYDLVSLLIGVNNQYRGRPLDEYRMQFGELFADAVALAGQRPSRVLVVSIPDWGTTTFAAGSGRDTARIAVELDAFNDVAREIAVNTGAMWADITPISREQVDLLADDGLHPSGRQYTLWTQVIAPLAARALGGA
ncbi:SGNH/GDSL hydrolase family protein [Dyella terrae]|uniref:SGNH/GDSL hydrolase family protein n=2 Tax=Dyella TaxID=231454 RepID=A0A4R0YQL1_9GAMM|nr:MULTISPECIES: SGNH/GDSL hydrolase family protein [Dyella]TBR37307.1 SGNH/GDSL hydrolase family protein [Dyella terrae]TCI08716.1 SGNH/GDSL hydrolase family protein [Dyella soli]